MLKSSASSAKQLTANASKSSASTAKKPASKTTMTSCQPSGSMVPIPKPATTKPSSVPSAKGKA
eukprot:2798755-Amphidinium_carterae.1